MDNSAINVVNAVKAAELEATADFDEVCLRRLSIKVTERDDHDVRHVNKLRLNVQNNCSRFELRLQAVTGGAEEHERLCKAEDEGLSSKKCLNDGESKSAIVSIKQTPFRLHDMW